MRKIAEPAFLLALLITPLGAVLAAENCEIEDWRYYERADRLAIEGTTTCQAGRITIRAYDSDDNFIGTDWTYIRGYSFRMHMTADIPSQLKIRYTIGQ